MSIHLVCLYNKKGVLFMKMKRYNYLDEQEQYEDFAKIYFEVANKNISDKLYLGSLEDNRNLSFYFSIRKHIVEAFPQLEEYLNILKR